jgi:hypothetical protein
VIQDLRIFQRLDPPCRKAVLKEQFDPPEKHNWKKGIEKRLERLLESEKRLHSYTADGVTYPQFEDLVACRKNERPRPCDPLRINSS